VACFRATAIDRLVLGNYVASRSSGSGRA
jgi:hypothetical protein